jgi:sulfonate transport system substrate-binding protein
MDDNITSPLNNNQQFGNISRRKLLKRAAVLGLSFPVALQVLAACGDEQTATSSTNTTPASSGQSTSAAQTSKKVRLGWGTGGLTLYAKTRGVFEPALAKKGISVEWVGPFPNHAPSLQAVVGGSADFSFGGSSTPALAAIIAGNPLVFTSLVISDPRTTAILVKPNSGIKSVKDLVGKKVAVNRSGLGEFLLIAALEKYGVPFDKVERVYLNPPDADPAFGTDKVDAWSIWSGPREIAEVNYGAKPIFIEGDELTKEQRIDVSSFLVLDEYAKKNPDVVKAVVEAYKVEAEWATNNPKEVTDLLAKQSGWTQPVVDKISQYKTKSVIIAPDDKATFDLQRAADWLAERQVLPGKIEVAKYFAKLP